MKISRPATTRRGASDHAFRTPTDFGTGVISPAGNVNVFLVKLSPTGDVLSAAKRGISVQANTTVDIGDLTVEDPPK